MGHFDEEKGDLKVFRVDLRREGVGEVVEWLGEMMSGY